MTWTSGKLLQDKSAVITGAASGIGRACARLMSQESAQVAVLDNNSELGEETAERLSNGGKEAAFFPVDVSDEHSVQEAIGKAAARFGRIDILVNNAGVAVRHAVVDEEQAAWDRCMAINVRGSYLCSRHAIPHMPASGGSIIHNASVTGIVGVRNRAAYSATKGALVALTKNMALDYASRNIRVNCVCPGFTRTPLTKTLLSDSQREKALIAMHPLGRLGEPEDIANAVMFLASDLASWITGHAMVVDGGFAAGRPEDI